MKVFASFLPQALISSPATEKELRDGEHAWG